MTKISTPPQPVVSGTDTKSRMYSPARITIERIRQVARAYTYMPNSVNLGGIILN